MKKIAFALFCILTLTTCKKDKDAPATEETPGTPTGSISGRVYQYDQFGMTYTTGLNTTTVSLEGKNMATVTDAYGRYTLNGVAADTYTLVFKKPGCGVIKTESISFKVEDTVTYRAQVADIPAFTLSSAYAKDTTWFSNTLPGIYYNANTNPYNENASVVAIIGKSPGLDLADPGSYQNYATASVADSLDFKRFFSYPLLKDTYTFKKDSVLYMKIYPVAAKGAFYYSNTLKTPVYTAYGTPYPTIFTLVVH